MCVCVLSFSSTMQIAEHLLLLVFSVIQQVQVCYMISYKLSVQLIPGSCSNVPSKGSRTNVPSNINHCWRASRKVPYDYLVIVNAYTKNDDLTCVNVFCSFLNWSV
jgi:hypothetical protein